MWKLEQVIQIVDGVAESSDFAQLLFRGPQMLLHLFELRKSFFDVLIELRLHLLGDSHEFGINPFANGFEALCDLLVQPIELRFRD